MNTYFNGATVRCSVTFTVNGTPTDPAAVTFKTKDPTGTVNTYTYPAQVQKQSVGVYYYDVDASTDGRWFYRFSSTGTPKAASEDAFFVTSQFL